MQLQQFLKAHRLSQKQSIQRGPPPLNKMQYFANDSRTEYQKQQQQMHQKLMQQRMANNNSIRDDSPNPMDFLEVIIFCLFIFSRIHLYYIIILILDWCSCWK